MLAVFSRSLTVSAAALRPNSAFVDKKKNVHECIIYRRSLDAYGHKPFHRIDLIKFGLFRRVIASTCVKDGKILMSFIAVDVVM